MADTLLLSTGLLALAGLIVFAAGLGHGLLGFGFPMLATPLLALMTDVRSAILLTLLPTLACNIPSILHGGRWRESLGLHWPLALYVVLGGVVGTRVLMVSDPSPLRLLLAAMIVLYLVRPAGGGGLVGALVARRQLGYALFGLAAGFLAGTVNVLVPLLIIFTLELGLVPLAMVQLLNLCFLSGKLAQLGTFGVAGVIDATLVTTTLPLALVAAGALWLGLRLRQRIDAATYRRWVRGALAVLAVLLCLQYALD